MRIAYLNPSGQLGGAEACLLDMVAVLREARPDWQLVAILGADGPLRQRLCSQGAMVKVIPFPPAIARMGDSGNSGRFSSILKILRNSPSIFSYRKELMRALEQESVDIIHTNGFKMHILGALAKGQDSKLVLHIHDYLGSRAIMAAVMRRLRRRVDAAIAVSESVCIDTVRVLKRHNVVPILNVVDLAEFSPDGPAFQLPDAKPDSVKVGLMGTMAWWKGHRFFLDAIAKLDRTLPIHAYVIGGALYETESKQESISALRQYAAKLGISDRVSFTGHINRPAEVFRALDIVVHASTEPEPFGRVIVEAMACGKPVISTALGGAAEIIAMGEAVIPLHPCTPEYLAQCINKLATDPALRTRLGRNGVDLARKHFGRARLAAELPPVYERLCR
jgi:glycosyltransferase involved in cell wall biosynthesis